MKVTRHEFRSFSLDMSMSEAKILLRYASIAKVGVTEFITEALIMHMVSYKLCPDYEPNMLPIGDLDDNS